MRRAILLIPLPLIVVTACQPPTVTPSRPTSAPNAAVGHAASPPALGVYVLKRVRGLALPADLKPAGPYQPAGGYTPYERVLAGWLYLTSDSGYYRYQTMICADLVDSAGRVQGRMDGGPSEGRYWTTGERVYFSDPVTDAPPDSIAVRVHGDTAEFVSKVYVLDRAAVRPRNLIPAYICRVVRASQETRAPSQ